ncbi:hypothetical protein OHA77_39280 [Streptosporangium sp. NBC_01639]|uniref:hypothetical protein n=1 Tax=unclassified Streptosporangium TaxID=2632669 RepID=UPI002DDC5766|nr:hypothetical protein [Streptosporangium sp. NBC_01756]WSC86353.1 hypothetical protein OIE48_39375 [Streptosporangium sp. NBC_01756]WTD54576.1 hypothetical protein OHA77_39280 [Streptosporangium sp. NBC_01639]
MSNPIIILLLTVILTAAIIGLIVLTVRITQRPRNALIRGGISPELIEQILQLKAADQLDQAIFLVRGETGMSHRAATRFVRKTRPPRH